MRIHYGLRLVLIGLYCVESTRMWMNGRTVVVHRHSKEIGLLWTFEVNHRALAFRQMNSPRTLIAH